MFLFRRSATCALTVILVTLSCGLAARAQVGVPQRAPVAPIGVAPASAVGTVTTAPVMGAAPVKTAPVASAAPVKSVSGMEVNGVNTGLLLLIGQIADGQMTMDEAWSKGLLDAPKVLQLLSQTQRLTEDERNETLQLDLAGLLVQFAPSTVATPERLSARVRVALCRYYSDNGDVRTIPLCEALIAEKLDGKQIKQPLASNPDGGSSSLWLSSVILLAKYYENVGLWQKAGGTWEHALNFWQDVKWWQGGVRIDAAQAYIAAGQDDKAQALYHQVALYGDGWMSGMALHAQASTLLQNGELAKAQQMLSNSISGEGSDEAKVTLSSLSAYAYYLAGDFKAASHEIANVENTFGRLNSYRYEEITKNQVNDSKETEDWIELWKNQPIAIVPQHLRLIARSDEPTLEQIIIRSFKEVPLTVKVDNPNVHIDLADTGAKSRYYFERQALLRIEPGGVAESFDTTLTVTSPQFPKFQVRVPVHVEVMTNSKPIQP